MEAPQLPETLRLTGPPSQADEARVSRHPFASDTDRRNNTKPWCGPNFMPSLRTFLSLNGNNLELLWEHTVQHSPMYINFSTNWLDLRMSPSDLKKPKASTTIPKKNFESRTPPDSCWRLRNKRKIIGSPISGISHENGHVSKL